MMKFHVLIYTKFEEPRSSSDKGRIRFNNFKLYGGNSNIHGNGTSKRRKNTFKPYVPCFALLGKS